ncbi:serine-rich adhesin for platelets-like [Liolophura sinensis]|uniref:serine-rich adhesin for platelets-like n=1 Tax=Liolophura sinensis TaxID=3198878 RepID=UPI0031591943
MSSGEMDEPDLGLVNLDWSCEECQVLKQQLAKSQEDHASNYTTLKQKIISTDLLIKKFKTKCDKYDSQTKKLEDTTKKLEKSQRDCQTLEQQMKVALEQLEPLKKANATLAKEKSRQGQQVAILNDKLQAAEQLQKQYQQFTLESDKHKKACEQKTEESKKKLHNLEISSKKQESTIAKLKESLNQKKLKLDEAKKSNKKLESELARLTKKADRFYHILLRHGLLPIEEHLVSNQGGIAEVWHPTEKDFEEENSSVAEEGTSHSFVPEVLSEEEEEEESVAMICEDQPEKMNMADIFSDILRFELLAPISPLAPSPLDSDQDSVSSPASGIIEEDELDKLAGLLESEILPPNNEQVSTDDNSSQNDSGDVDDGKEHLETVAQAENKDRKLEAEDIGVSKTSVDMEDISLVYKKAPSSPPKKSDRKCFMDDQMPKLSRRLSPISVRLPSLLEDEVMENSSESRGMPFPADVESLSDSDHEEANSQECAGKITRQGTTEFVVSKDVEIDSVGGSSTDQDGLLFEANSRSSFCSESQENDTNSGDLIRLEDKAWSDDKVDTCDKTDGSYTTSQCLNDDSFKRKEQESIPQNLSRNNLSSETSGSNNSVESVKESIIKSKELRTIPPPLYQGNVKCDAKLEQKSEEDITETRKQTKNGDNLDLSSPIARVLNETVEESKKDFSLSDIREMSLMFGLLSRKKRKRCSSEPSRSCVRHLRSHSRSDGSSPVKKAFNRQKSSGEVSEPVKGFAINLSSALSNESKEEVTEQEKETSGRNKASPRQLRRSARLSKGQHVCDQDENNKKDAASVFPQEVQVFPKERTEYDKNGVSGMKEFSDTTENERSEILTTETPLSTRIIAPRRITRSSAKAETKEWEKRMGRAKTGVVETNKHASPNNVTGQRRVTRSLVRQTSEGWLENPDNETKTNVVDVSESVVEKREERIDSGVENERHEESFANGSAANVLSEEPSTSSTEGDMLDRNSVAQQELSIKNISISELEKNLPGMHTIDKATASEANDGHGETLCEEPMTAKSDCVVDANDNIRSASKQSFDVNRGPLNPDLLVKDDVRLSLKVTKVDAPSNSSLGVVASPAFDSHCDNSGTVHNQVPARQTTDSGGEENAETLCTGNSTNSVISQVVEEPKINSEALECSKFISEQSVGTRHESQSGSTTCTDSNTSAGSCVVKESTEYSSPLRPRTSALPLGSTFVPIYIPTSTPASSVPSVIRQSTSSITVVSPETSRPALTGSTASSLCRSETPSSNSSCSISASSPVSPLPPSPFEYLNIIPISPLPPSPVPAEPLSPLPSSPSREVDELEDTVVEEPTLEAMDVVAAEVSPQGNHAAILQPTPLPQAITPLPITPSEARHPVTPLSCTPTSNASEHATCAANVTPSSAAMVAASKQDPKQSTSRHPSGEVGPSRRNLELSFSDSSTEHVHPAPGQKDVLYSKSTQVAGHQNVLEDQGGVSLLRAKKRVSHYKPADSRSDSASALGTTPALIERKKRKSSGGNASQSVNQSPAVPLKASGDIHISQEGNKQKKKWSSGRRSEAGEITVALHPGGDNDRMSNEDVKNQAVCIGRKKRKSSDGENVGFAQKVLVLSNANSSGMSKPQALPADLVKLVSQELEGYLRLSGADPSPLLQRILRGKSPEVVVRILIQEINKTGAAFSINKMLELLPAADVTISPSDGPYITPQEDQLVRLLQAVIVFVKDRDHLDMSHVIMQSIWKEVFSCDTCGLNGDVTVRLKTQLCRLYTAMCRLGGKSFH